MQAYVLNQWKIWLPASINSKTILVLLLNIKSFYKLLLLSKLNIDNTAILTNIFSN